MSKSKILGSVALLGLVASVIAANWLVVNVDPVPVGFGQLAPAGFLVVGIAFGLRDAAHTTLGRTPVLAAILTGAALSFTISGSRDVAIASATAYLLSETADLLVYEPLQRRDRPLAVLASNLVGIVIDSVVFLTIISALEFLPGQIIGKLEITVLVALIAFVIDRRATLLSRHA